MKVSILIPAFNSQEYIIETIQSCISQGEEFIHEIIVIDDFSTDSTFNVVSNFAKTVQTKIVLKKNNKKGRVLLEILL